MTVAQAALLLRGKSQGLQDVSSPEQTTSSLTAYGHDGPARSSTTQSVGNSPGGFISADEAAHDGPHGSQSHEDAAVATTLLSWNEDPMNLDGQQYDATASAIHPHPWVPEEQPNLALVAEAAASMADLDAALPVEASLEQGDQKAETRTQRVVNGDGASLGAHLPAVEPNSGMEGLGDPVLIHSPARRSNDSMWESVVAGRLGELSSWPTPTISPVDSQVPIQDLGEEDEGSGQLSCDDGGNDLEVVPYEHGKRSPTHRQQRRGAFFSVKSREETANTRKMKACVRCRMQKIRVGRPRQQLRVGKSFRRVLTQVANAVCRQPG